MHTIWNTKYFNIHLIHILKKKHLSCKLPELSPSVSAFVL